MANDIPDEELEDWQKCEGLPDMEEERKDWTVINTRLISLYPEIMLPGIRRRKGF